MDPVVDLLTAFAGDIVLVDLTLRDVGTPSGFDRPAAIAPLRDPSGAITVTITKGNGVAYAGPLTPTRQGVGRYQVTIPTSVNDDLTLYSLSVSVTHGNDTTVTLPVGIFRLAARRVALCTLVVP